MTDETIFNNGETSKPDSSGDQPKGQDNQSSTDYNAIFKDHLASIKNEQGEQKYSDVEKALKALKDSQEYIKTLEGENQGLKEMATRNQTIEEALERLTTNRDQNTQQPQSKNEIDVEELRRIAREENMLITRESQQRNNKQEVSDTLIKKYGNAEKALEAFNSKAKELGVATEFLTDLAGNSPKAVLAYFDTTSSTVNKNITSSVNTESFKSKDDDQLKPLPPVGASSAEAMDLWRKVGNKVKSEMGINN